MGKSPGKWIKAVLFGKKSSKTGYHKGRENVANVNEVLVSARASEAEVPVAPPFPSQLSQYANERNERDERKLELENKEASNISNNDRISLPVSEGIDSQESTLQDFQNDPEKMKQKQAATIVQAAFRGYLARRAFWALKGIIRLQALIRGHLVRRQAIATLCCVMGIVKLQSHIRGVMARRSDGGLEVQKKYNQMNLWESKPVVSLGVNMPARIGKLSTNAFVRKLVASSPPVMPLRLHDDAGEPNSVWNWLERWSASCFWKPVPQPKKASKLQKKQANGQLVEIDSGRPKLSVRRIRPANLDGASVQATSEFDKPKRNLRKVSSHPAEIAMQENPQNELEKVKRNLRKVHNPVVENSVQSQVESDKPKQSLEKFSSATNPDIVEQGLNSLAEKANKEMASTVNSSAEKMKNEMAMTVNSSTEEMKRETASTKSSAEKMNKETALKINNSAEKMKKETSLNSSAEKMRQETAAENGSAEKMKKETTLTVNISAEKMNKETALTINNSAEKMKKEMARTVNSSAEKMRQETATVNGSAEKMKKETALTVKSSNEKVKKETALTVNNSAEKVKKEIASTVNGSAEKMKKETTVAVSKSPDIETMVGPLGMNETSGLFHADPSVVDSKRSIDCIVKDENNPIANVEPNRKGDSTNNENQKSGRKASNLAKQDHTENGPQISPALPSYMAATESAKAKLRLQGSPRFSQDGGEKINLARRQSLPISSNSKINSQSPRTQRLVHAGKEGSKSDRPLSSRDRNAKATQVEWRR